MKILCVHPNFELYGSDRSFASAVECLETAFSGANITVLLPRDGPIMRQKPFDRLPVVTRAMFALRRRGLIKRLFFEMPRNVRAFLAALRDLNAHDVNYINTIVGVDFIIMARFSRRPAVIHVREIPNGIEMTIFRRLLIWSKATLIFNSEATRKAFAMPPATRTQVVLNGVEDPGQSPTITLSNGRPIRILMIGRLNHWKGQEILVSAIGKLGESRKRVVVRIVGGTFHNQDDLRQKIVDQIASLGLQDTITIQPFQDDPSDSYRWADLVVVPSRLPEPFGRVATEAMAFGRPVIASRHGGLIEIVVDRETGLLFTPSDADDLARAINLFVNQPELLVRYGEQGRRRFLSYFSTQVFAKTFAATMQAELAGA